jgi:hypothetical protein
MSTSHTFLRLNNGQKFWDPSCTIFFHMKVIIESTVYGTFGNLPYFQSSVTQRLFNEVDCFRSQHFHRTTLILHIFNQFSAKPKFFHPVSLHKNIIITLRYSIFSILKNLITTCSFNFYNLTTNSWRKVKL